MSTYTFDMDTFRWTEAHIYGSSRIGVYLANKDLVIGGVTQTSILATNEKVNTRGKRNYELANHLGNVLVTISDKRQGVCSQSGLTNYEAEIVSATDYYAFGSAMPGREYTMTDYKYGFNGKECDKNEEGMGGGGSTYDYGFRIYNPNLGKFLSVDPLSDEFPWNSTYAFSENMVIDCIDLEGLERYYTADGKLIGKYGKSTHIRIVDQWVVDFYKKNGYDLKKLIENGDKNGIIAYLNSKSIRAYVNTPSNRNLIFSKWANKYKNLSSHSQNDCEYGMSLFTFYIEDPNGSESKIQVFVEGSTAKGPSWGEEGGTGRRTVDIENSVSPIKGWKRGETIHTHPYGDPDNFSNTAPSLFTGGDLQLAVSNNIDLYLACPYHNQIGYFDVCLYKQLCRASLESQSPSFKKMSNEKMFELGGPGDPYFNPEIVKLVIKLNEIKEGEPIEE